MTTQTLEETSTPAAELNDPGAEFDIDLTPPDEPEEEEPVTPETPEAPTPEPETPTPEPETPANTVDEEALFKKFQERQAREAAEAKQAADVQKARDELKALGTASKQAVTDTLEQLGTKYGVQFTFADHQALLGIVERLADKGADAAKLELGEQGAAASQEAVQRLASSVEDAFYNALPEAKHKDFTQAVQGKGLEAWVDALRDLAPPTAKQLQAQASALVTEAAASFPADSEFAKDFSTATAKAKNPAEVIKAVFSVARKLGFSDPIMEPVGTEGKSLGPKKTFEQLSAGYGAGTLTAAEDAEYLRLDAERRK